MSKPKRAGPITGEGELVKSVAPNILQKIIKKEKYTAKDETVPATSVAILARFF